VAEGEILEDKISTGLQGAEQGSQESKSEIRHRPGVSLGRVRTSTVVRRIEF